MIAAVTSGVISLIGLKWWRVPVALYVYKTMKSLTANWSRALKRQNVEIYDSYFVIIRYEKICLLTTKYNVPHRHTVGSA